jgi:class 3 adenylate cyclase
MTAVHRYEGTVNQVMGDGIMALFGAPLAHEDHCRPPRLLCGPRHAGERDPLTATHCSVSQGVPIQIRVGLNSGKLSCGRLAVTCIWITPP